MDLGTVSESLKAGNYASFEACFADIQLIWDNCKLYNMAGSDIYKVCERMERTSRRELNKFRTQHGLPAQGSTSVVKKPAVTPSTPTKEKGAEPASTEVTTDMKVEFCNRIKKLTPEQLTKFVGYVQSTIASSMTEMENDRVQVRVDDWSRQQFDTLSGFVDDMMVGSLPSKRTRTE